MEATTAKCLPENLNFNKLDELLQLIGKNVISYAAPSENIPQEIQNSIKTRKTEYQERHKTSSPKLEHTERRTIEIVVQNGVQLEKLRYDKELMSANVSYDVICQLPRLQHLYICNSGELREEFFVALANKPGAKLETLSVNGNNLSLGQLERICSISCLQELCVGCDEVPIKVILKLHKLRYFYPKMPVTCEQIFQLVNGLPLLKILDLRQCPLITEKCVLNTLEWMAKNQILPNKLAFVLPGLTPAYTLEEYFNGRILICRCNP